MLAALGVDRVVLVQASVYGNDNQCMIDGLRILGQRARGVAVITPDITDAELKTLHTHGVRGVRLNIVSGHDRPVSNVIAEMRALAKRISHLGWHLQLFVRPDFLPDLQPIIEEMDIDIVIDHMGLVPADGYQDNRGFQTLLSMLNNGCIWVKVSGAYRVGSGESPWYGVVPMARAIVECRPDRIVWGSDWPHTPPHRGCSDDHKTVMPFRPLDTGHLLNLLAEWSPDPEIRRLILVSNPARLYDFETVV